MPEFESMNVNDILMGEDYEVLTNSKKGMEHWRVGTCIKKFPTKVMLKFVGGKTHLSTIKDSVVEGLRPAGVHPETYLVQQRIKISKSCIRRSKR